MKIRTLEEIERDERVNGPYVPTPRKPPGPVLRFLSAFWSGLGKLLLGIGELLLVLPKFLWRLISFSVDVAVILGIIGCIVFGLVYLFG